MHFLLYLYNFSKRLEPADHGKSNQELKLIKTTTLERKTPNTVCCANSIELYYIMVVVLVTLVLCFKKLAGQMTHFQWTSGLDGWNSSECECNSTTRQGASFHFLILASPLPKSKIENEIH